MNLANFRTDRNGNPYGLKKCKYHCDYGDGEYCHYKEHDGCIHNKSMEELEGKIKVVTQEEHKLMCHDYGYKKLNPKFPYRMEKAKWYIMFLLFSHIITPEEFDDLYSRLPEWAR